VRLLWTGLLMEVHCSVPAALLGNQLIKVQYTSKWHIWGNCTTHVRHDRMSSRCWEVRCWRHKTQIWHSLHNSEHMNNMCRIPQTICTASQFTRHKMSSYTYLGLLTSLFFSHTFEYFFFTVSAASSFLAGFVVWCAKQCLHRQGALGRRSAGGSRQPMWYPRSQSQQQSKQACTGQLH
jgi:hypothetical protein